MNIKIGSLHARKKNNKERLFNIQKYIKKLSFMSGTVVLNRLIRVQIPKIIFDRSDWVKYLVVVDWHSRVFKEELFEAITTEEFNKFVFEHVNAYIHEKKAPPKAIANAIMNITDDILSNRDPVIRAGDYIQLQNFMRG